jgi:nitrogen fixation/metabolism regulation signal transduction histidine kinase
MIRTCRDQRRRNTKSLQILVNLIAIANNACDESAVETNAWSFVSATARNRVRISDSRQWRRAFRPENLTRIFNHGFTTRRGGHGFGLPSVARWPRRKWGRPRGAKRRPGKGATFTL